MQITSSIHLLGVGAGDAAQALVDAEQSPELCFVLKRRIRETHRRITTRFLGNMHAPTFTHMHMLHTPFSSSPSASQSPLSTPSAASGEAAARASCVCAVRFIRVFMCHADGWRCDAAHKTSKRPLPLHTMTTITCLEEPLVLPLAPPVVLHHAQHRPDARRRVRQVAGEEEAQPACFFPIVAHTSKEGLVIRLCQEHAIYIYWCARTKGRLLLQGEPFGRGLVAPGADEDDDGVLRGLGLLLSIRCIRESERVCICKTRR